MSLPGSPGVLDMAAVEHLRALEPLRGPDGLIDIFIRNATIRVNRLNAAVEVADMDEVVTLAHSLRGSAGTIGARKMALACDALEQCAAEGDAKLAEQALTRLQLEADQAYTALDTMFPSPLDRPR